MDTDAARDRVVEVSAKLREQLADIAEMQKKQAALKVQGQAADGAVEVTVDARGQLVKTVIDESYLDDHDFDDLAGFITEAAQTAARDAGRRVAELMAPITERQRSFPSLSDIVEGVPDLSDLLPPGLDMFGPGAPRSDGSHVASAGAMYDHADGDAGFPTVTR